MQRLEAAIQKKVTASSVWTDLNAAIASRSRYDIEAALACVAAMALSFPTVTEHAKVAPCYELVSELVIGIVPPPLLRP